MCDIYRANFYSANPLTGKELKSALKQIFRKGLIHEELFKTASSSRYRIPVQFQARLTCRLMIEDVAYFLKLPELRNGNGYLILENLVYLDAGVEREICSGFSNHLAEALRRVRADFSRVISALTDCPNEHDYYQTYKSLLKRA